MRSILFTLLCLLLFTACDKVYTSSPAPDHSYPSGKTTDSLRLELHVDAEEVASSAGLEAHYRVTNIRDDALSIAFSSGCQYGFTVTDGQAVRYDSRRQRACTQALTTLQLQPGQSRVFTIAPSRTDGLTDLGRGTYALNVFLMGRPETAVSAHFTVR